MGANQSSQEPVPINAPPTPPTAAAATQANNSLTAEKASDADRAANAPLPPMYEVSLHGAQQYMSIKVPAATALGGITGLTTAYYTGDAIALTTGIFGVTTGMTATAFLIGTYSLQSYRQKNDVLNFAISGCVNGAWIMTALRGKKIGAVGAVLGGALGALIKVGGDEMYSMSRDAWVASRKFTIGTCCPVI
jgi:hypothetical protein